MKRLMTGTLALLATFTLAACGSATVESGSEVSPDATVAPLERGDGDLLSSSESETSEERSSKESTEASTSKSEPAPEDRGAQEVEQAPTPQVDTRSEERRVGQE